MGKVSSEVLAAEMGCGPICDNCHMALVFHGETLTGQVCDVDLAMHDLWRSLGQAVLGGRRCEKARRMLEGER